MDRPLVFCPSCPTIIARHSDAVVYKQFLVSRRIAFKAEPFFTFDRIRFPNYTITEIETLLDSMDRAERMGEVMLQGA